MPSREGGETMNCDVRTGWERRIWCIPDTRDPVKVSDMGKHVLQDSIRVTSSRLNCEASSNGSLILALDTWQGHSSEHMPVRILMLTHQIHSRHPKRGWFLFEWVWASFQRGCFSTVSPTACPWVLSTSVQGLLITASQQMAFRAMVLSALPGSLSALIFLCQWMVIVVWPPSICGLCPQGSKQAGRLWGYQTQIFLILIYAIKFPVISPVLPECGHCHCWIVSEHCFG